MKFGQLNAKQIPQQQDILFHTAQGQSALAVHIVNQSDMPGTISIAHVPQGQNLQEKHWMLWNQPLDKHHITDKFLMNSGDQLYARSNIEPVSLIANGIELENLKRQT